MKKIYETNLAAAHRNGSAAGFLLISLLFGEPVAATMSRFTSVCLMLTITAVCVMQSVIATTYHATTAPLGIGNGLSPVTGATLQTILGLITSNDVVIVYPGTHALLPQSNVLPSGVVINKRTPGATPVVRVSAHISGNCQLDKCKQNEPSAQWVKGFIWLIHGLQGNRFRHFATS